MEIVREETLGAVVQDMNFDRNETSGQAGVELFQAIRQAKPDLPVLLMTAWASLETAVQLVKEGAADYIQKPWNDEKMVATVKTLTRMRGLELENSRLRSQIEGSRRELAEHYDLQGIVYASEAMHRVVSLAANVADSSAPVLITGPNGSGKERIAEIIQANSRRSDKPFLRINVGAIPEELMESELFGAEAGAYTGLQKLRQGRFEAAHEGTLFLDEIDALSLAGQVKLLRVLQSGEYQRLGSSRSRQADVRVLSATNASLTEAIEEGRFREDLYFRLNVVELTVPPLDSRPDDILPLARHFLKMYADETDGQHLDLTGDAETALFSHTWPGNVRELANKIHRATLLAEGPAIAAEALDLGDTSEPAPVTLDDGDRDQRHSILRLLSRVDGNVSRAADSLGVSRQALYRKMTRLGIELKRQAH